MKTIKQVLPKCDFKVNTKASLIDKWGSYDATTDVILIDCDMRKDYPRQSILVLLHEIMHSTGVHKRNNRRTRLGLAFGEFKENSLSHKVEEIICELAGLVVARNMGFMSNTDRDIFEHGIKKYKEGVPYIPWREVVSAVYYFSEEPNKFLKDLIFIKRLMEQKHNLVIKDGYDN